VIAEAARRLRDNVQKVIVGKDEVIDMALAAILCEGHILFEDVPGIGKTTLARTLSISLGCTFQRIQFTPDLLPSDVTGINWFNQKTQSFEFRPGPVMSQVVLADEINRATPRTQSALLEAMQERQVTIDGVSNPIELEGTFPLPEAQLDRFLMCLQIGYPEKEEEDRILLRFGVEDPLKDLEAVMDPNEVMDLMQIRRQVRVEDSVRGYILDITRSTREHLEVQLGASPRASLALYQSAQAWAAIKGREYVLPDDVKLMSPHVLTHRLIMSPQAQLRGREPAQLIEEIVDAIAVPVED